MFVCDERTVSGVELESKYLDARCPLCRAGPGKNCRAMRASAGKKRELEYPHMVRVYVAVRDGED